MFICAEIQKTVQAGELLVMKQCKETGGIGVYFITGEKAGHLIGKQPAGCVDYWTAAAATAGNRVLATAAIVCGRILFLSSDSKALSKETSYSRLEVSGYGMMVASTV